MKIADVTDQTELDPKDLKVRMEITEPCFLGVYHEDHGTHYRVFHRSKNKDNQTIQAIIRLQQFPWENEHGEKVVEE